MKLFWMEYSRDGLLMSDLNEFEEMARRLALTALGGNTTPTPAQIREAVDDVLPLVQRRAAGTGIDVERLLRRIETDCNVWVAGPVTLVDTQGHVEWLSERRRGEITWSFWSRYRRFLEDYQDLPPNTARNLHEVTDLILGLLEEPDRSGPWDRRGMVVGEVQSGKTSNYIGLICKAADAGYKLIVILAGVHNSLRSQTQLRVDEGFLGFDTQRRMRFDQTNVRIGVGSMPGAGLFISHALTNSGDQGDFKLAVARNAGVMVGGGDPVILVVKKYKSVLENLIKYATSVRQEAHPETGAMIVRDVPLLVIDDEADHASVNTAPEPAPDAAEVEPRAINRLIRQLLGAFDKSAYVGYTATPFANIFIKPPTEEPGQYGEDLFPRSFIVTLKAPSDYVGPARVFGLPDDWRAGTEAQEGLPIVRTVADYSTWIPDGHKKTLEPGALPATLKEAIRSFVLACAARRARGQAAVHNSMLVHVTRFIDVQGLVASQVRTEIDALRREIQFGGGAAGEKELDALKKLWNDDCLPTSRQMADLAGSPVSWPEVHAALADAIARIHIRLINGKAEDILEYYSHPEGLSVIAIGGDKLSRGLTLQGLTVSYYLRASRMYDTLMQMGRWFGYRPGYTDLCRLYTTPELESWYKHIALADVELRREFEYMLLLGKTPMDYGLRVRSHPDALMVTSRAKMRNSTTMNLSFAGTISETIVFHRDTTTGRENWDAGTALLTASGVPSSIEKSGTRIWKEVPAAVVLRFLQKYRTHESATKTQARFLVDYIEAQQRHDELTQWTVVLVSSNAAGAQSHDIGTLKVGLVERTENGTRAIDPYIAIKRLVNPPDEALDLSGEELKLALLLTRERFQNGESRSRREQPPTTVDGLAVRAARPAKRGMLILYPTLIRPAPPVLGMPVQDSVEHRVLGIAVSFPRSATAQAIAYDVANNFWDQEIAEE